MFYALRLHLKSVFSIYPPKKSHYFLFLSSLCPLVYSLNIFIVPCCCSTFRILDLNTIINDSSSDFPCFVSCFLFVFIKRSHGWIDRCFFNLFFFNLMCNLNCTNAWNNFNTESILSFSQRRTTYRIFLSWASGAPPTQWRSFRAFRIPHHQLFSPGTSDCAHKSKRD